MADADESNDATPKQDARLSSFLRRAAPVIAAERGLTPSARIKLQTIAAEMRLPGELLDEALTELQHESQKGRHYSRWERGFARFLAQQLKKLDNKILTYDREQKAIRVAEDKYQLTQPQAREIIGEVAKQLNIRRISASEAERHVETSVKEKVGLATWIDTESRERLYSLGEEWGLTREHVAALVDHYLRFNKDRRTSEQRRSSLLVAGVGILFLLALSGILYVGYKTTLGGNEVGEGGDTSEGSTGEGETTLTPPDWWNDRMSAAVASAMAKLSDFNATTRLLASDDMEQRGEGYQQVADEWLRQFDRREEKGRLEAVLKPALLLEPDSSLAERSFDGLLQRARPPQAGLPSGDDFYRRGLEIVELGVELLDDDLVTEERQESFRRPLDQLTGTYLATLPGGVEMVERYQTDYLQRLFDHLLEHAATDPGLAQTRFDQLRKLGSSLVTQDEQRRWATELLVELLRASPESWKQYQNLMQLCVAESNRDHLPALLDYLEFNTQPDLALELARRFQREFKLEVDESDPVGVAAAMRRTLGLSRVATGRQQSAIWSMIANDSKESLASRSDLKPDDATPQELMNLAYWGTIAARLAQQPGQAEAIQAAVTEGPTALDSSDIEGDDRRVRRPPDRDTRRLLERLLTLDEVSIASATTTIRALGERVAGGFSLHGYLDESRALARYALRDRDPNDQKRLIGVIGSLVDWNEFLLAIADQVDRPGVSEDHALNLISELLSLDLVLDGSQDRMAYLQSALLERVVNRLGGGEELSSDQPIWTRLESQLAKTYDDRGKLFSPWSEEFSSGTLPSEALYSQALAFRDWGAEQLPVLKESSRFRDLEESLRGELYLAENDLQRTVVIQNSVVDLLVDWLQVARPDLHPQAKQIQTAYRESTSKRRQVVNQIFDGEQAWLRLWLLLRS